MMMTLAEPDMEEFGWDDAADTEAADLDRDTEIIDWWSYAADNYRFTSDAADSVTAAQPRWVVAEYFMRAEEYVYEALSDEMTLAEAEEWLASPE